MSTPAARRARLPSAPPFIPPEVPLLGSSIRVYFSGVGAAPTTLASAREVHAQKAATAEVAHPGMIDMKGEQQAYFLEIYRALARGPIRIFLETGGFQMIASVWVSLYHEVTSIQKCSKQVADVHPLAFLLLLRDQEQLRKDLRSVFDQKYVDAWKAHIVKIASSFRLDATPPHQRTLEDFANSMLKHEAQNTLRLGAFLAQISENQRAHVKQLVKEKKFEELFRKFLEKFYAYQISQND